MCGPVAPRYKGEIDPKDVRTFSRGGGGWYRRGTVKYSRANGNKSRHTPAVFLPRADTSGRARKRAVVYFHWWLHSRMQPGWIAAVPHPLAVVYTRTYICIYRGSRRDNLEREAKVCLDRCAVEIDRYDKCSTGAITIVIPPGRDYCAYPCRAAPAAVES